MTEENRFESIKHDDMSNFKFGEEESFSHERLIQEAYRRCLDALAKEMIEGFWEVKKDLQGNFLSIYHPDTRKTAIEAVKTLKNAMISDIKGTEYDSKIKELLIQEEQLKQKALDDQWKWIQSMDIQSRKERFGNLIVTSRIAFFYEKAPMYVHYIDDKLEIYRQIFEQLELCLAYLKYFKRTKRGQS